MDLFLFIIIEKIIMKNVKKYIEFRICVKQNRKNLLFRLNIKKNHTSEMLKSSHHTVIATMKRRQSGSQNHNSSDPSPAQFRAHMLSPPNPAVPNNKAFASQTRLAGHKLAEKLPKRGCLVFPSGLPEASLLFQRTFGLVRCLRKLPPARAMLANYLELMCMLIFAAVHHRVGVFMCVRRGEGGGGFDLTPSLCE